MIYFDHNSTTPIDNNVIEAMLPYLATFYGNPSGLYRAGRITRSAVDTARAQVAALVDTQPEQIVFTSSGTEANNLAINNVPRNAKVAVSAIEHPSVTEPARKNRSLNNFTLISVEKNGKISLSVVKTLFQQSNLPALVSIMLANNENGVIQDIPQIFHSLKDKQTILHTDAVQAVGKIPVSFKQSGADLMTLSSHKIYGPKGCGALVIDKEIAVEPLLFGGGQENNRRAGTENVAAIVGFGKAAEITLQALEQRAKHSQTLRTTFEQQLKTIPGLVIFAEQSERLPNTIQFGIQNIDGEMLLMQLDQNNIAVSSGSACSSGGGKASPVLTAMGIDISLAKSAIRISLGKDNTEKEIITFVKLLKAIVMKKR